MKWKKSDGTEITYDNTDGFVINDGNSGFSAGTQTTTLVVPASQTDRDKTYICLITSNEHDVTEQSATVNLKVFSEYSTSFDIVNSDKRK